MEFMSVLAAQPRNILWMPLNLLLEVATISQEKLVARSELRAGRITANSIANALCAAASQAAMTNESGSPLLCQPKPV